MESFFPVLLVLTFVPGTLCQEINFTRYPRLVTECYFKTRGTTDSFFFTGTVGNNVPLLIGQGWSPAVNLEFKKPAETLWRVLCAVTFQNGNCEALSNYTCTCDLQSNIMNFWVNYTLEKINSGAHLRGSWTNARTNKRVFSNWEYTLPEVCDIKTAILNLTVNNDGFFPGVTLENMEDCTYSVRLFKTTPLLLCCSEMAMPCFSQISFRGTVVATGESPCVTYSSPEDDVTGILQLSYSVCTPTDYIQGMVCNVAHGVVTTRNPLAGVVTTRHQTQLPIVVPTRSLTLQPGEVPTKSQTPITTAVTTPDDLKTGVKIPEKNGPTSDDQTSATRAPEIALSRSETNTTLQSVFWSVIALFALVIACASVAACFLLNKRRRHAADRASQHPSQRNASEAAEVPPEQEEYEVAVFGSSVDTADTHVSDY